MTFTRTEPHTRTVVVNEPESVKIDAVFIAKDFIAGTTRSAPGHVDYEGKGSCNVRVTEAGRINVSAFGLNGMTGTDGLMSVEFDREDLIAMAEWLKSLAESDPKPS